MDPVASGPSPDEEPEQESSRTKSWAYFAAVARLGGLEREQRKLRKDVKLGRIRPSEAQRRQEDLKAAEEDVRKRVEEYTRGEEPFVDDLVSRFSGPSDADSAQTGSKNVFRRSGECKWEIRYDGGAFFQVRETGGVRALVYLLNAWANPPYPDVRYPQEGAAEVWMWMTESEKIATSHGTLDDDSAIVDYRQELADIHARRVKIETESSSPSLSEEQAQKLSEEDSKLATDEESIQAILNRSTNHRGHRRKPRSPGVDAVDSALRRFLKQLEEQCPKLHAHLKRSLKCGATPRYQPIEEVEWEVHL